MKRRRCRVPLNYNHENETLFSGIKICNIIRQRGCFRRRCRASGLKTSRFASSDEHPPRLHTQMERSFVL
ncbi:hypothetical protein EYF80_028801 [Liparis tanakae]|uniref:Uncharacterized protein n=1 Tax=Liparis tanakae TaxID=230148 RepID=A0A4Z2H7P0_9TELE|nr:hypothetical protein EYF80_028801 [Liparis tanakae]